MLVLLSWMTPVQAQTAADYNEGLQVTAGTQAGDFTLSWWGKAGRTYFIQQSFDLMTWQYVPVVVSGAADVCGMNFTCSDFRQFWRLRYTDQAYTGNVEDADFDGDQVSNLLEAQNNTDPFSNVDSDGDGIPNDWEVAAGANEADPYDMLLDTDGDRIPNLYEYAHATDGWDAESHLGPHITVDQVTGTDTTSSPVKRTIDYAISRAGSSAYSIIRIKPGVYDEYVQNEGKRVLLLADQGGKVVLMNSANILQITGNSSVIRDCVIDGGGWNKSILAPIRISLGSAVSQVAMINCVIRNHGLCDRAPVWIERGTVTVSHCLFVRNFTTQGGSYSLVPAASISLTNATSPASVHSLILRNSVLWNEAGLAAAEIYAETGATVTATNNIIRGGSLGGINMNPLLDRYDRLSSFSPAIRNTSGMAAPVGQDIDGEAYAHEPDIGPDEYKDSDEDGLPDWWENQFFGSLTVANGSSDSESPEGDGLLDRYEYLLGFNPLSAGTFLGTSDFFEAVRSMHGGYYPAEWLSDADGDGLAAGWELCFGSSDSNPDSNGDGISDLIAFMAGWNPAANDMDGDGLGVAAELALGTSALSADTDGDGVNDNSDPFPLDPFQWTPLVSDPGDIMGPQVVLEKPAEAVLVQ